MPVLGVLRTKVCLPMISSVYNSGAYMVIAGDGCDNDDSPGSAAINVFPIAEGVSPIIVHHRHLILQDILL